MELSKKQIVIGAVVLFVAGAAVGRFSLPAKVETKIQEKIVVKEVVKWKTKVVKQEQKDKDTVIIETRLPDGTTRKETHIIDRGSVYVDLSKEGQKDTTKESEKTQEKTVEYDKNNWIFTGMVTPKKDDQGNFALVGGFDYGLSVQRRIGGPLYLGVFGMTNKIFGLNLGISL